METRLVKIAKEFHWEMAHRLPLHTGGCQNLHGHSYKMIVEIEGIPGKDGMVMDYADLKKLVKPMIDEIDHAFMCSEDDLLMVPFLKNTSFRVTYVPFPTTAENVAIYLGERIRTLLLPYNHLKNLRIRICETLSSHADITIPIR